MADEHPISKTIRQCQLQFTRLVSTCHVHHQLTFVIYQSKIRQSNCHGNPGLAYLNQISKYLSTDKTVRFSAEEIANCAKDKQLWNLSIAAHKFVRLCVRARILCVNIDLADFLIYVRISMMLSIIYLHSMVLSPY